MIRRVNKTKNMSKYMIISERDCTETFGDPTKEIEHHFNIMLDNDKNRTVQIFKLVSTATQTSIKSTKIVKE